MNKSIYDAPDSNLISQEEDTLESGPLTAAERFAESKRQLEEANAIQRLNLVWGIRAIFDGMGCAFAVYIIYGYFMNQESPELLVVSIFTLVYLGLELVAIFAYFKRSKKCVIPLHIFAGLSLLNFPLGTILSVIHFFSLHKVRFPR